MDLSQAEDDERPLVRRAPFADNPAVGHRGRQAQERLFASAQQAFAERGYFATTVDHIAAGAGCSRAAFYQYFASKEDLFRTLTGVVTRALEAATAAMGPVTPDADGHGELVAWLRRYRAIYLEHAAVFEAFQSAASAEDRVVSGAGRVTTALVEAVAASWRVPATGPLDAPDLARSLSELASRTNRMAELLSGQGAAVDDDGLVVAVADVIHRSAFGLLPGVNARDAATRAPARRASRGRAAEAAAPAAGHPTREALLAAGRATFAERGYHATTVLAIAKAAGVSRGILYHWFDDKDALFRELADRAGQRLRPLFDELPDRTGTDLRGWLEDYVRSYAEEAAVTRVWSEAMARDTTLGRAAGAALDRSRQQIAALLDARPFGDSDHEAVVFLALLEALLVHGTPSPARWTRIVGVLERGLLGISSPPASPPSWSR